MTNTPAIASFHGNREGNYFLAKCSSKYQIISKMVAFGKRI